MKIEEYAEYVRKVRVPRVVASMLAMDSGDLQGEVWLRVSDAVKRFQRVGDNDPEGELKYVRATIRKCVQDHVRKAARAAKRVSEYEASVMALSSSIPPPGGYLGSSNEDRHAVDRVRETLGPKTFGALWSVLVNGDPVFVAYEGKSRAASYSRHGRALRRAKFEVTKLSNSDDSQ